MNRLLMRLSKISIALCGCALAIACGGGGGGGDGTITPPGSVSASFTGDSPAGDISMTAGTIIGGTFQIQVNVDSITDLFGVEAHVTYDPATAVFLGFDSSDSILTSFAGAGQTQFNAVQFATGEIAVAAALTGQGFCSMAADNPGGACTVDGDCPNGTCDGGLASATGELITLSFQATSATTGNDFAFAPSGTLAVTTCAAPLATCDDTGVFDFTGGTMTAQ